jgi:hypothetical protein
MMQVQTFGSFVNGLGMHSSDLDLVITGLLAPDHPQNGGQWAPISFMLSTDNVTALNIQPMVQEMLLPATASMHTRDS